MDMLTKHKELFSDLLPAPEHDVHVERGQVPDVFTCYVVDGCDAFPTLERAVRYVKNWYAGVYLDEPVDEQAYQDALIVEPVAQSETCWLLVFRDDEYTIRKCNFRM